MTPEERQMLGELFQRVQGTASSPRDAQAEAFINDAVKALPFAPYVLAQTVLVQQQALEAAAKHVAELQEQARQAAPPAQDAGFLGNLGRSLFGGAPSAPPPPPPPPRPSGYDASAYQRPAPPPSQGYAPQQPAYAPPPQYAPAPPQAGPWGAPPAAGGGFMSGALHTAAGVAGGVLLGNALGGLLGGHGGGLFGGGAGGFGGGMGGGGGETINNFYEAPSGESEHHGQDASYDDASYNNDDQQVADNDDYGSDNGGTDDV